MGTDMDVCNYFIHNHKDVADVKFVNWTDIVFARFKTPEAAEKFISLSYHMFYGSGAATTNGAAKAEAPKSTEKPEMELGNFNNKKAGDGLRDLLIENLHLDSEDVGQPKWMKKDEGFKARFAIKMDDNAIGYFVKKWNELEISVAGETVKAELTVQPPKEGRAAKRGRKRPNNLDNDNKRAKISPEDY